MYILIAIIGFIIGFIFKKIIDLKAETYGIIEIDENTQMCKIKITSSDLGNPKTKKAIFNIVHGSNISRDNPSL